MKPLPVVPWTTEDCNIEWRNTVRHHRQGVFGFMGTQPTDRRDAELMLYLMRKPPHIVRLWVAMRTAVNVNLLFAGQLT